MDTRGLYEAMRSHSDRYNGIEKISYEQFNDMLGDEGYRKMVYNGMRKHGDLKKTTYNEFDSSWQKTYGVGRDSSSPGSLGMTGGFGGDSSHSATAADRNDMEASTSGLQDVAGGPSVPAGVRDDMEEAQSEGRPYGILSWLGEGYLPEHPEETMRGEAEARARREEMEARREAMMKQLSEEGVTPESVYAGIEAGLADVEKNYGEALRRRNEARDSSPAPIVTGPAYFRMEGMYDDSPEARAAANYGLAKELYGKAGNMMDASFKGSGFFRGAKDTALDWDTWTSGLTKMVNDKRLDRLYKKVENGETLTADEGRLLDAATYYTLAGTLQQLSSPSLAYSIGKGFMESVPYMIEFALTYGPASSVTRGLARAVFKKLGRNVSNKMAKSGVKVLAEGTEAAATGAVQTPMSFGRIAADTQERMMGDPQVGVDKEGKPVFLGRGEGDDFWTALGKSVGAQYITNISEVSGVIPVKVFRFLSKPAQGAIRKLMDSRYIKAIRESDFVKGARAFGKPFKIGSAPEELFEEYFDGTLNASMIGDTDLESLYSWRSLSEIAGTVLLTQAVMGGLGMVENNRFKGRLVREYGRAEESFGRAVPDKDERDLIATYMNLNMNKTEGATPFDVLARQAAEAAVNRHANDFMREDGSFDTAAAEKYRADVTKAISGYFTVKPLYDAYLSGITGRKKQDEERIREEVAGKAAGESGQIITVILQDGRRARVTSGNVVPTADGRVDVEKTGDHFTAVYEDDGTAVQLPADDSYRLEVVGVEDAVQAAVGANNEMIAREEEEAVYGPRPRIGELVYVRDSEGNPVALAVGSEVDENGNFTAIATRDYDDKVKDFPVMVNMSEIVREGESSGGTERVDEYQTFVDTGTVSDDVVSRIANKIAAGESLTPEEESMRQGASERVEGSLRQIKETQSALSRIPKDEKGNPVYEQADTEMAWNALLEQADGDVSVAQDVADSMVKDKEAALKKMEKTPAKGTTPAEKLADAKKRRADIEKARAELEHWQRIAGVAGARVEGESEAVEGVEQTGNTQDRGEVVPGSQVERSLNEEEADASASQNEQEIEDIQPIGKGVFGNIYDQFRGKVKEAFDFLFSKKEGYLKGVFHRDEIGDIDLAWGEAKTKSGGKGLAHILRKHVETLSDFTSPQEAASIIEDVVKNGVVSNGRNGDTYNIEKGNYRVVVARDTNGNWVLTAFDFKTPQKDKKKGTPAVVTPGETAVAEEAGAVASNLSDPKDSDQSGENQGIPEEKENSNEISAISSDDDIDVTVSRIMEIPNADDRAALVSGLIAAGRAEEKAALKVKNKVNARDTKSFIAEQQRIRREQEKASAEVAYWEEVQRIVNGAKEVVTSGEDKSTINSEKTKSVRDRLTALGEVINLRDYILRSLATGEYKFIWGDNKNGTKGLGSHLGFGNNKRGIEERRRRIWLLNNEEGLYPEQAAERIFENIQSEYPYLAQDDVEVFNEMLDVLRYDSAKDMVSEAEEMHRRNDTSYEAYDKDQAMYDTAMQERDEILEAENEAYRRELESQGKQVSENEGEKERYRESGDSSSAAGTSDRNDGGVDETSLQREVRKFGERMAERLGGGIRFVYSRDIPESEANYKNKREAYGYYDTATGEVVVVLDNHTSKGVPSVIEVAKTVMHEVVGHKGVRGLLGEEGDAFFDDVYRGMKARSKAELESKYGGQLARRAGEGEADFELRRRRLIADEYIAQIAERGNNPGLLRRVIAKIREVLRGLGVDLAMTDNDIRNVLRRSTRELTRRKNAELNVDEEGDIRFRQGVNERFNEELAGLTEENADRVVLSLGRPSDILLSAGVEDKPMKLYGNKVIKKMKKHGFELSELQDLPDAVSDPIAVFNNYEKEGNRSILTELRTTQGNFLVTVDLGIDQDVDFNIISSVFGKGSGNIVDWINKGYATYINKEKAREFLSYQSPLSGATAANSELLSATNIVENFENPKVEEENTGGDERYRRAYHGSPADFERFDHSFMGTGEGAQAYGWGTYVTEVNGIAKSYAENLTGRDYARRINSLAKHIEAQKDFIKTRKADIRRNEDYEKYAKTIRKNLRNSQKEYKAAERAGNEKDMEFYQSLINIANQQLDPEHHKHLVDSFWEDINNAQADIDKSNTEIVELKKKLKDLEGKRNLYTVEIPDDTGENYLDWEQPVSDKQAKAIEHAAKQEFDDEMADKIMRPIIKGNDFNRVYAIFSDKSRLGSDKAASEFLSRAGFTGIKYPAEATTGGRADGAKNYVIFDERDLEITDHIRYRLTEEEQDIVENAKREGSYMKAPNGKPTRLNEKQWAQVRTRAFKAWFGDWEKAARIGKLRGSSPVEISGEEYKGKYELNRDSAKQWLKDNLRGEYTNKDTGEKIEISKVGANKVTSHGERDEAHLKSIVAIPQLIENSIFIEEQPNEKGNEKYDSYRYYVCGLKIDGVDYTAKIVIGVKGDSKYYDHRLTQIEKGTLIDNLNAMANHVAENQNADISTGKDTKLLSILQTNSSKVVDENGEPRVVYHGTNADFTVFDREKIRKGGGFWFSSETGDSYAYGENMISAFLNMRNPALVDETLGQVSAEYEKRHGTPLPDPESYVQDPEVAEIIKQLGYDGLIFEPRYIVYSPNQIKSATGNTGAFSRESDDMRYRLEDTRGNRLIDIRKRNHTQIFNSVLKYVKDNFSPNDVDIERANTGSKYMTIYFPAGGSLEIRFANHTKGVDDVRQFGDLGNGVKWSMINGQISAEIDISLNDMNTKDIVSFIGRMKGFEENGYPESMMGLLEKLPTYSDGTNDPAVTKAFGMDIEPYDFSGNVRYRAAEADYDGVRSEAEREYESALDAPMDFSVAEMMPIEAARNAETTRILRDMVQRFPDTKIAITDISRIFAAADVGRTESAESTSGLRDVAGGPSAPGGVRDDMRYRQGVNKRFNDELQQQIDGTLPKGHVYGLGRPSEVLLAAGIPDLPIELAASRLGLKASAEYESNHPFELGAVMNLPEAIQHPIAVFDSKTRVGSKVILVELKDRNGNNFVVAMNTNVPKSRYSKASIQINDIRSIYPKDNVLDIMNWINRGDLLRYADKKKIEDWITQQRSNSAEVEIQNLDVAANIVENFENPKIGGENTRYRIKGLQFDESNAPHYDTDIRGRDTGSFKESAGRMAESAGISLFDEQLKLKQLQNSVTEWLTGSKKGDLPDGLRFYDAENQAGSIAKDRKMRFDNEYKSRLFELRGAVYKALGNKVDDKYYYYAKTLNERIGVIGEEKMAANKATMFSHLLVEKNRGHEFPKGFTDPKIYPYEDLQDYARKEGWTDSIEGYIADCENRMGDKLVNDIWSVIGEISEYELTTSFKNGLITRDHYDILMYGQKLSEIVKGNLAAGKITEAQYNAFLSLDLTAEELHKTGFLTDEQFEGLKRRYEYYLPLKGDSEPSSEDMENYEGRHSRVSSQIKDVKGGNTRLVNDPISRLLADVYASISYQEKMSWIQSMYQALRLAERKGNGAGDFAILDNWVVKDEEGNYVPYSRNVDGNPVFTPTEGEIASGEVVKAETLPVGTEIRIPEALRGEHLVRVKHRGRTITVYFRDPGVARAVNDHFVPRKTPGWIKWSRPVTQFMSKVMTQWNVYFTYRNLFKDFGEAASNNYIQYGASYLAAYTKNYGRVMSHPHILMQAAKRTLRAETPYEKMVEEFFKYGGEVSYTQMESYEKTLKDFEKELRRSADKNGVLRIGKRCFSKIGEAISDMNKIAELNARLATFITSREMGYGLRQSIRDAKEVTVNFDRRGKSSRGFGTYFLFWNAGRQSNRRKWELMRENPGRFWTSRAAMGLLNIAQTYVFGVAMSAIFGVDWEDYMAMYYDIPDYMRYNNIVILSPGGNVYRIPLSPAFSPYKTLVENVGEAVYRGVFNDKEGKYDLSKGVGDILKSLSADLGDPTNWNAGDLGQKIVSWAPAPAVPLFEAIFNVDFTGRPIYKEGNTALPGYKKAYQRTDQIYVDISEWLNEATGGEPAYGSKIGRVVNPGVMEHVIEGFLGGLIQIGTKFYNIPGSVKDGRYERLPFVDTFYFGDSEMLGEREVRNDIYEARKIVKKYDDTKGNIKRGGLEERDENGRSSQWIRDNKIKMSKLKYALDKYDDYTDKKERMGEEEYRKKIKSLRRDIVELTNELEEY